MNEKCSHIGERGLKKRLLIMPHTLSLAHLSGVEAAFKRGKAFIATLSHSLALC